MEGIDLVASPDRPTRVRIVRAAAAALLFASLGLGADRSPGERGPRVDGRWLLEFRGDGRIELTLERRGPGTHSNSSDDFEAREFRGLERPPTGSEVSSRFELARDAGVFFFEGNLDRDGGSGRFRFEENPEYAAALDRLGYGRLDAERLYALAVHDVSRQWIAELDGLGYRRVAIDDLLAMRIHGANPEFVRGLRDAGYANLPVDDLVAFRIHGVTRDFVKALAAEGFSRVAPDDLVAMRIHGVTPQFVSGMKALTRPPLAVDDLVAMRIHGVSPEFARDIRDAGYGELSADDLVAMRIHGVTAEFARTVKASDPGATPDDVVSRRIHRGRAR